VKKHNGIHIPPIIKEKDITRNPIRKNVLWHHRLETNKGLSILLDIIEAMPDYTFHIAGNWIPSICTQEIINSVETRMLSPDISNVFFYGLLEDMSDLFSMCSLSLSTSLDESFGISIAESIANGIPSVSSSAGVGKYSDKIIPYEAHYSEWVKEIRICDQSIKEAKNKSFIKDNYSSDHFKQSWDNVLWS
jgi:glycosyltransferase involved in cell wall biosynthesis